MRRPSCRPLPFTILCLVLTFCVSSWARAVSTELLLAPTGTPNSRLGASVSTAGDMNGDGFDDFIVGAYDGPGLAHVYFGGSDADTTADLTLQGEFSHDRFGISVGTAGDVNGDGYADVIVGEDGSDVGGTDIGRIYLFYGGPHPDAVADFIINGKSVGEKFGNDVASAGDVNGDGFDDIIVGAYRSSGGAGRAYVFYLGPSADGTADLTFTGVAADDVLGSSVGTAGDVNGDGFADLIVGAHRDDTAGTDAGCVHIYFGGPGADDTADLTLTGEAPGDLFGWSASTAGDVNGDGYADWIAGAHENDSGSQSAGRAYLFHGGASPDANADLILEGADAFGQFGYSVGSAGDVDSDGFPDLIVGSVGSSSDRVFVYLGGPAADSLADLTFDGAAGSRFGDAVGTAGDVDGDGFDEFIVGAEQDDIGGNNAGRAYVFASFAFRIKAPDGDELWAAGQPATVRWLGAELADLDLSTDGGLTWSSLAAGLGGDSENQYSLSAPGTLTDFALVRLTYAGELPTPANSRVSAGPFRIVPAGGPVTHRLQFAAEGEVSYDYLGTSVAGAGDVNGDGFEDLLAGAPYNDAGGSSAGAAYVFLGGIGQDAAADITFLGAAAGDKLGTSVAFAGDMNGDGYDDLVLGAPENDTGGSNAGRAYVHFGGPGGPDTTPDLTLTGEAVGNNFGSAVSGAGDVNRDGFDDIMIGAYAYSSGQGRVYVYYGGLAPDATLDLVLDAESGGDWFGTSVAGAGDVNNDGFDDMIVGAIYNNAGGSSAGRAYVFHGGSPPNPLADVVFTGITQDRLGVSVGPAGDMNGDGLDDVVVGAPGSGPGHAHVYFGDTEMDAVADLVLVGEALGDAFGVSARGAGDVNADGFDDLVVGAEDADFAGNDAGRAYVYFGGPVTDAAYDMVVSGDAADDNLGRSVAGAGDWNHDGFADFLVGATGADGVGTNVGEARLYDCNRYHLLAPSGGTVWNVGAEELVAWSGAAPADMWLSVDGGNSYQLLQSDIGGNPENVLSLTVPHQPTRFGKFRITPADATLGGEARSDSLFTIEASIALLNLKAEPFDGGGVLLNWETDPGPDDLAGYRVERAPFRGSDWRVLAALLRETSYHDISGAPGMRYRLTGINRLGDELLLGETALTPRVALAAWPLPYRSGDLNLSFATFGGLGGGGGRVQVAVYDIRGRLVRTIVDGTFPAGSQIASWDGRDPSGRDVAGGVYFLRATSAGESHHIKLIVVR